jgi:hypothetical protein
MISYDDLERALARWKARGQQAASEATPAAEETSGEEEKPLVNGRSRGSSELSGEIDLNELVEE